MDLDLIEITMDREEMRPYLHEPFCLMVFETFETHYPTVGFERPWIGYFFSDGNQVVATGGFKGRPTGGKVEIAYGTVPRMEGQGYASKVCEMLVHRAISEVPNILVTARTLMEENASTKILKKNGFRCVGVVNDLEDGEVWEWHLIN